MPQAFETSQPVGMLRNHYLNLETSLQSECTVSGALCFVLYLSRVAAIAPIKFQKVRDGWRISLSRFYYAYTILYVVISHVIIGFTTFDTRKEDIDGYEASSNKQSMFALTVVLFTVGFIVGLTAALTGYKRMSHMIECLIYLKQINKKLDHLYAPSSSYTEIKAWLKILFLFIHGYFGAFLDYGVYLHDVISANNNVPLPAICNVVASLDLLHLQLLSIHVNLVITLLVSTQQRLNSCLDNLLEKLKSDCSIESSRKEMKNKEIRINIRNSMSYSFIKVALRGFKTTPYLLRELIKEYCSLCHVIKLLNEGNGIALMMLLVYCTSYMVTGPYFVVTVLYQTKSEMPVIKIVSIIGWCTLCFTMLLTVTEPCHQTHLQFIKLLGLLHNMSAAWSMGLPAGGLFIIAYKLEKTKHIVNQLIRYTPRHDKMIHHELKIFKYQISLNPVSFFSMHLLKFDRKLSIAVLSLVVTYLSVVITL